MSSSLDEHVIRIGLLAGEPVRLEGLRVIFEQDPGEGHPRLMPFVGTLEELLADNSLEFLVIDLNSSAGGFETLQSVRRARPGMRQIVIGPEREDELVMNSIVAGARAYLASSESPETVRQAIEIVVSGSIWAPRRLLSRLIDRLLGVPQATFTPEPLHLTDREREVLELILAAKPNREIAKKLGIEERTVKAHVGRLMKKTGAENRIELSVRALSGTLTLGRTADSASSRQGGGTLPESV